MDFFSSDKRSFEDETVSDVQHEGKVIENIEFTNCTFKKCTLVKCELKNCVFIDCKFENCTLSATIFTNSRFVEVSFIDSKVIGIDWTKAKETRELSFKKSAIDYSNFRFLDLKGIHIVDSTAIETDFVEAKMQKSDLRGTDFNKSIFLKTDLTEANFKNAKNYNIDLNSNKVKKAQFSFPEVINLLTKLDIEVDY